MDTMQRCMEGMGSVMGGGAMGVVLVMVALLLLVWVIGLVALGALGFWGIRRLSDGSARR
jgi:uncharacterized membrane protein